MLLTRFAQHTLGPIGAGLCPLQRCPAEVFSKTLPKSACCFFRPHTRPGPSRPARAPARMHGRLTLPKMPTSTHTATMRP